MQFLIALAAISAVVWFGEYLLGFAKQVVPHEVGAKIVTLFVVIILGTIVLNGLTLTSAAGWFGFLGFIALAVRLFWAELMAWHEKTTKDFADDPAAPKRDDSPPSAPAE